MKRVFLYLPLIALPIVLFEVFTNLFKINLNSLVQVFIQNVLFLNTIHILITFYLILRFPRFKRILNYAIEGKKNVFITTVLMLFFASLSLYMLGSHASYWGLSVETGKIATFVFAAISGSLASFHAIWQIRGIGHTREFSGTKARPQDKNLFSVFVASVILIKIYFLYAFQKGEVGFQPTIIVLVTGSVLISFVFVVRAFKEKLYDKALFYSRLVLFPLFPLSTFCTFLVPCLHGIEYYYFFRGIKEVDQEPFQNHHKIILAGTFLILLTPFIPLLNSSLKSEYGVWLSLAAGVNYGLAFIHYYLDEKIFTFSNIKIKQELEAIL